MKWITILFILGTILDANDARLPFKPPAKSMPFVVYFTSRHRGMCVGTMVSRMAALTAAVCVVNIHSLVRDTRPISVVTAATYRHPRRGIKVPVDKILIPKFPEMSTHQSYNNSFPYLLQSSAAMLLLKHKVPDSLAEVPIRPATIDYKAEEELALHEECLVPGWHFFHKGDKIYPGNKFLLSRTLRVQFVNVVKKHIWCETLAIKFQTSLEHLGFDEFFDKKSIYCIRDPERTAQPCHGMYGAPLICRGKVVAMMTAPDAQWTNCTGLSNIFHKIASKNTAQFMECIYEIFLPENLVDVAALKKSIYPASIEYDESEIYDHVLSVETDQEQQENEEKP